MAVLDEAMLDSVVSLECHFCELVKKSPPGGPSASEGDGSAMAVLDEAMLDSPWWLGSIAFANA